MVKEEDSRSEGCEFEFRARYWMDFFTIICCKICITCLKRQKINEKEAEDGPFLKKQFKLTCQSERNFQGNVPTYFNFSLL